MAVGIVINDPYVRCMSACVSECMGDMDVDNPEFNSKLRKCKEECFERECGRYYREGWGECLAC